MHETAPMMSRAHHADLSSYPTHDMNPQRVLMSIPQPSNAVLESGRTTTTHSQPGWLIGEAGSAEYTRTFRQIICKLQVAACKAITCGEGGEYKTRPSQK